MIKQIDIKSVKEYMRLIARVVKIDKKAARYMLVEAPKKKGFMFSGDLSVCFTWELTPQKRIYWAEIYHKLH